MSVSLPDGVWPTMLTPFTAAGDIDYGSLTALTDWYIENGAAGLFAVCQSSEMYYLNFDEKVRLAAASVEAAAGKVPVVASGHTSDTYEEQLRELKAIASTGIDTLVLIPNRLAAEEEDDRCLIERLDRLVDLVDIPLGLYECPYPYKRLLTPEVLEYCAGTGRFTFLKDTSCSIAVIRERLGLIAGSGIKLYNANAATLLASLRAGASGYCGVMAAFFPLFYRELCSRATDNAPGADKLQQFLGPLSLLEKGGYPLNAKVFLHKQGILASAFTRSLNASELDEYLVLILDQVRPLAANYIDHIEECIK